MNMLLSNISKKHRLVAFILLGLIIFLVYSRTFQAPFVFDDFHSIVDKSQIRDYSSFLTLQALTSQRPLADFTFAVNYHMGGLNVFGFHAVNTTIHILNSFMVYLIAFFIFTRLRNQRITTPIENALEERENRFQIWAALATALFFALHPVQTQAVTYIVQRYTSLSAFFSLLCIWSFIRARIRIEQSTETKESRFMDPVTVLWIALSLIFAVAAFLSKQTAAMLPGLIILTEIVLFKKSRMDRKKIMIACIPVLFLFILFILYSGGAFRGEFSFGSLLEDVNAKTMETTDVSRLTYLVTQLSVIMLYMRMIILPYGQNIDPMVSFTEILYNPATLFSLALIFIIIAIAVAAFRKRPMISFAIGWFFIALSVESSIIPIRDAMFEHRMYLPMLGPALIFGFMFYRGVEKINKKAMVLLPAGCLIIILATTTIIRNEVWRDPVALWKDSIQKNPYNYRAWANLGQAQLAQKNISEAQESFHYSLKLKSRNPQAMGNLGIALARQAKLDDAIPYLKSATALMPESFDFHYNLGVTYGVSGKHTEAIAHYRKALKIRPDHLLSRMNLGVELGRMNRLEEAEQVLTKALEIAPDNVDLLMNTGIIQFNMGRHEKALEKMLRAEKISPDSSEIMTNIGIIHHRMGNYKEALQYLGKAVQLDPGNNRAKSYAQQILQDIQSQALRRFQSSGDKNE